MLAALALLTVCAPQPDVELVVQGRIELLRAGLPAPFNLGGFNDPIELVLAVDASAPPQPAAGGGLAYTVDVAASYVEFQGVLLPLGTMGTSQALEVRGGLVDRIVFDALFPVPSLPSSIVEIEWRDAGGAVLASDDLFVLPSPVVTTQVQTRSLTIADPQGTLLFARIVRLRLRGSVGERYCAAEPTSTGVAARIDVAGSNRVASNQLELRADDVPSGSLGIFLVGGGRADVLHPGGSSGRLCVGGGIGRYVGPGQVQAAGAAGELRLALDLANLPRPNGPVAALPGETWRFTAWFRDTAPGGGATSNFTDGVEVAFL